MCSACMTISPRGSNSAVEQSRRSLMFAECALRTSAAPISSQAAFSAPADDLQLDGVKHVIAAPSPCRSAPRAPAVGHEQRQLGVVGAQLDLRAGIDAR